MSGESSHPRCRRRWRPARAAHERAATSPFGGRVTGRGRISDRLPFRPAPHVEAVLVWRHDIERTLQVVHAALDAGGIAGDEHPGGHVGGDDAAGADQGVFSDLTSGRIVTFTPMRAPRRIVGPCMHLVQIGWGSFAIVTPGARNTSSSMIVNCAM